MQAGTIARGPRLLVLAAALASLFLPGPLSPPAGQARAGEASAVPDLAGSGLSHIREIDLVHLSHTDYGFTDHPAVCREMQRRYLDVAIDAVLATMRAPPEARFCWTAETTVAVLDWWEAATPQRREMFLEAVRSGQLEVTALPINNTPFLDRAQWRVLLHWLPDELWSAVAPKAAVQNDVNGFPRAGALALLERGIRHLFTGINSDSGGPPFQRPGGFWWKMPDGRRLLVWLNYSYPDGHWFFESYEWRRGPVPLAADTRYRPPRPGEIFASDEASVREAHRRSIERLRRIEAEGYRHPTLAISVTNQWRIDNDPPFPPLADFVATWTRLGLKPALRLTTVGDAMRRIEEACGPSLPEREGEWTDWWANGTASGPREVAASRFAKRYLAAACSAVWDPVNRQSCLPTVVAHLKDLCLFDEHTWGSSLSVAFPWSLDTLGQYNEKARLAYRPMALSQLLLSQMARARLAREGEGLYVVNTSAQPYSGWIDLVATCLREPYVAVDDPEAGTRQAIRFEKGIAPWGRPVGPEDLTVENTAATFADNASGRLARFWVEGLPGNSIRKLRLSTKPCEQGRDEEATAGPGAGPGAAPGPAPAVELDDTGWPRAVAWPGMARPLFVGPTGDVRVVRVKGFAPRWIRSDVWGMPDGPEREAARGAALEETSAAATSRPVVTDTLHTAVYTQSLKHGRFLWAFRRLEIFKREPRARLTVKLHRISSDDPEIFFVAFRFPCEGALPLLSCGGEPFTPFEDQLPGSCRDYFAVDGWARYRVDRGGAGAGVPSGQGSSTGTAGPRAGGSWLWVSRDAPLLALGEGSVLARRQDPPPDGDLLLSMVYNNFWYTNFVGNVPGAMEFQYDLAWKEGLDDPGAAAELAASMASEPVVLIQPAASESPIFVDRLYQP